MEDTTAQDTPADGLNASGFPDPSPQEAMFFFNMIKNMNNQPDINWDGVATDSGFKNAAVAKKRFYQIKQKLGLDSRTTTAVVKTPRKPRKPKATAIAADAADADGEDTETKPAKGTKRRKTNVGKEVKTELSEANVEKQGRTPLPCHRMQQRTPSDSGGEDKGSACGDNDGARDCITAVLPSVEGHGGADIEGTV